MRTGIVVSYNTIERIGLIKDSNNQKIRFYNENSAIFFRKNDVVNYSVALTNHGLRAVNVTTILDGNGAIVNLDINVN
ncbi:hypothetical protein [Pedobacter endophyticus]|uniref:Uncharacterized protein n=1 Tax=Pedobacter endophyticus TaxID=2789740 RepID=A0A7S9L0E1_9SPHI|nr:hypothetical protein [Pedobacter endophyticus]QPH40194.1 hypothetical protein IZT61_02625 [Pedobacter endophyticus]